ncbi:MAG: DUF2306 domain-containing protein [Pseudomonadota bacterium]
MTDLSLAKLPLPRRLNPDQRKKLAVAWGRVQAYGNSLIYGGIVFTSIYLVMIGLPRVLAEPTGAPFFPDWQYGNWIILLIHVATAIPPLLIGPFAFSKNLRNKSLKWHRWIGVTYCVCIWISAVTGVMLATANTRGIIAQMGFGSLGITWFTTTWLAYTTARTKDIVSHRRWMLRSYAVTLAVVSIRPMFLMEIPFGISADDWYRLTTWMCWVPNLIIAEIYIRITKPNARLIYC